MVQCSVRKIFLLIFAHSLVQAHLPSLDELALKYDTDKGSQAHYYTRTYEKYFRPVRQEHITLLEIGFFEGHSAQTWEEYFPNAQLYFLDIDQDCYKYMDKLSKRCSLHMVDQGNETQLRKFAQEQGRDGFDIIIDDGGHTMRQQLTSFKELFPYVRPGGVYIIEDLHTSFWQEYGGAGTLQSPRTSAHSMTRFLESLVEKVHISGARIGQGDFAKCPPDVVNKLKRYEKEIESIHFYTSLCFVFKR